MYGNPYFINPTFHTGAGFRKPGFFSSIHNINWENFLNNAQKTLGIINQAIPIAYQIKPIMNNAKTMFRVMGAMREDPIPTENKVEEQQPVTHSNQPMFFI